LKYFKRDFKSEREKSLTLLDVFTVTLLPYKNKMDPPNSSLQRLLIGATKSTALSLLAKQTHLQCLPQ
jgi:hypothetical protein